jgi:hypothetical protein
MAGSDVAAAMRTHVEFRSAAFSPYPGEEQTINPGRYGRKLAEFIAAALRSAGLDPEEPRPEDWGWAVKLRNREFPLWIGCGNQDDQPEAFLCFIEPHEAYVRRRLRKIHAAPTVEIVRAAIDDALRSHGGIQNIRWSAHKERNSRA